MHLRGARVALTGASTGIGEAGALAFARCGARLALSSRRTAALEEVARRCREAGSPEVLVHHVDVTRPEHVAAWAQAVEAQWGGVEVVVANAGVGHYGPFATMREDHFAQLLDTNLLGVWRTVQAFLPMLKASRGHVIVVGSVAGRVSLPYLSTYCGTKAALVGWTRGVRPELRRDGVTLTLLAPGATKTGFARNALRDKAYQGQHLEGEATLDKSLAAFGQGPRAVGRALVHSARWRRREVHLTLPGVAGALASHLWPHLLPRLAEPLMRPRKGGGGGAGKWKH